MLCTVSGIGQVTDRAQQAKAICLKLVDDMDGTWALFIDLLIYSFGHVSVIYSLALHTSRCLMGEMV